MDITAKVDYRAKGKKWSDIKAHVDRLHKNGHYSNKNIDLGKSDYNYQGYIHNAKKDNDDYFLPYIQFQNLRKASTGHNKEIYKSVNDYFKKRGYSNQRNSIFEIGNQKYRKKYYKILEKKGLTDKQIRKIEAKSLLDDVIEYDENSCQDVGAFSVNCDESTAHIHFQNLSYPPVDKFGKEINLMPRGKKWRRKLKNELIKIGIDPKTADKTVHKKKFYFSRPSASFNNTWQVEFPKAKNKKGQFDSRKALRLANDKYSHMIIKNFNKELSKAGVKDFRLNLIRTHNVNHQDYNQWLSSKVANDHLKKANDSLTAKNKSLKSNSKSITDDAVSEAEPRISKAIDTGKSSASESASATVSASVSSTVSSINDSIASSNSEWQSSINNSLAVSASASAKASVKAKDKSIASQAKSISSANSSMSSASSSTSSLIDSENKSLADKSASFDKSAYGGYATQLSNVFTGTFGSQPRATWLAHAKGTETFTDKNNQPIHDPIKFMANWWAHSAKLANKNYKDLSDKNNTLMTKNKHLSDKNTSLTNKNKDLNDSTAKLSNQKIQLSQDIINKRDKANQATRDTLIKLGMNKVNANHYYHANKMGIGKKSLFQRLIDTIHSKVKDAKEKADNIIIKAKQRAKAWLGINDNGYNAMQDYIYNNDPMAQHNPNQDLRAKGYYDPADLYGNDFLTAYNDTADKVHKRKVRERQRQNGYQPPQF